jgi:hypothetical protein
MRLSIIIIGLLAITLTACGGGDFGPDDPEKPEARSVPTPRVACNVEPRPVACL